MKNLFKYLRKDYVPWAFLVVLGFAILLGLALGFYFYSAELGTLMFTAVFIAWYSIETSKLAKEMKRTNSIQDFIDVFVMPQQVVFQDEGGTNKIYKWNLLIKNASSYPIYLNRFSLNGVAHLVGSSVIPTGGDNWYAIPIPKDVQEKKELSLEVEFVVYMIKL